MKELAEAIDSFLTCLWSKEVAHAAASSEHLFKQLLTRAQHHCAARKFVGSKKFDTKPNINSARTFLKHVFRFDGQGRKKIIKELPVKTACLQGLDNGPLGILAVLCQGEDTLRAAVETVRALSEGAERLAKWSNWSTDPDLITVVQEQRPQSAVPPRTPDPESQVAQTYSSPPTATAQTAITSDAPSSAFAVELTRFHPAPPGQVLSTCPSCGTKLRLRFGSGQTTDGKPLLTYLLSPRPVRAQLRHIPGCKHSRDLSTRVTSTDAPTRLPATHIAPRHWQDQPNILANASLATSVLTSPEADSEVHSSGDTPQPHGLSDSGNQDVRDTFGRLDTPGPSDPSTAAPRAHEPHHTRAPTTQSHGTESLALMPLSATRPDALLSPTTNPTAPADAALTAGKNQLEATFAVSPASVGPGNKRKRDEADEGTSLC
jgi:hypothetical protein